MQIALRGGSAPIVRAPIPQRISRSQLNIRRYEDTPEDRALPASEPSSSLSVVSADPQFYVPVPDTVYTGERGQRAPWSALASYLKRDNPGRPWLRDTQRVPIELIANRRDNWSWLAPDQYFNQAPRLSDAPSLAPTWKPTETLAVPDSLGYNHPLVKPRAPLSKAYDFVRHPDDPNWRPPAPHATKTGYVTSWARMELYNVNVAIKQMKQNINRRFQLEFFRRFNGRAMHSWQARSLMQDNLDRYRRRRQILLRVIQYTEDGSPTGRLYSTEEEFMLAGQGWAYNRPVPWLENSTPDPEVLPDPASPDVPAHLVPPPARWWTVNREIRERGAGDSNDIGQGDPLPHCKYGARCRRESKLHMMTQYHPPGHRFYPFYANYYRSKGMDLRPVGMTDGLSDNPQLIDPALATRAVGESRIPAPMVQFPEDIPLSAKGWDQLHGSEWAVADAQYNKHADAPASPWLAAHLAATGCDVHGHPATPDIRPGQSPVVRRYTAPLPVGRLDKAEAVAETAADDPLIHSAGQNFGWSPSSA